jgi:hypothetical protein
MQELLNQLDSKARHLGISCRPSLRHCVKFTRIWISLQDFADVLGLKRLV